MYILRSVKVWPTSFGLYMYSVVCRLMETWNSFENNCWLGRGEVWTVVRVLRGGNVAGESLCGLPLASPSSCALRQHPAAGSRAGLYCAEGITDYCQFRGNELTLEKRHFEPFFRKHKLRRWWMMERFRDCSSWSSKAGNKGAGDLSCCYLFLCLSFISRLITFMGCRHLYLTAVCVCIVPFFSAALTLLTCSPLLLGVWVRCWGIEDSLL